MQFAEECGGGAGDEWARGGKRRGLCDGFSGLPSRWVRDRVVFCSKLIFTCHERRQTERKRERQTTQQKQQKEKREKQRRSQGGQQGHETATNSCHLQLLFEACESINNNKNNKDVESSRGVAYEVCKGGGRPRQVCWLEMTTSSS